MMLLHLGEKEASQDIMNAIDEVLGRAQASEITPDLGGTATTQALGAAIERAIRNSKWLSESKLLVLTTLGNLYNFCYVVLFV